MSAYWKIRYSYGVCSCVPVAQNRLKYIMHIEIQHVKYAIGSRTWVVLPRNSKNDLSRVRLDFKKKIITRNCCTSDTADSSHSESKLCNTISGTSICHLGRGRIRRFWLKKHCVIFSAPTWRVPDVRDPERILWSTRWRTYPRVSQPCSWALKQLPKIWI